ncbi:hypothetical protein LINGRAHAP2_LOCUS25255 [Linum grandiflorum]
MTSSPSAKGERDSQQAKKRIKALNLNKSHEPNRAENVWTKGTENLFRRVDDWYVADSDSEDVATAMLEDDEETELDDDDPLCPSIFFTAAEKMSFRREWRSALVVKGLGRRIPYPALARRLNYLWAAHGGLQISDLHNGCFLVRFRAKEDYETALTGGPWMLGETYLTVHRWHKDFDPWNSTVKTTLVWIQLPNLPIEFYHPTAVKRIASKIGIPVRLDRATEEGARAKYARVCVEVDLTKPLLSKYKLEGKRYFIGYEGLTDLCTSCGCYGAPSHRCSCRIPSPVEDLMMETNVEETIKHPEEPESVYGQWMIPRRRQRRSRPTAPPEPVPSKPAPLKPVDSQLPHMASNPFFSLYEENADTVTGVAAVDNPKSGLSPSIGSKVNVVAASPTTLQFGHVGTASVATRSLATSREAKSGPIVGISVSGGSRTSGINKPKSNDNGPNNGRSVKLPPNARASILSSDGRKQSHVSPTDTLSTLDGAGNPSPSGIR